MRVDAPRASKLRLLPSEKMNGVISRQFRSVRFSSIYVDRFFFARQRFGSCCSYAYVPFQRIAPRAPWCCKLYAKIDLQSAMSFKSISQISLTLRIKGLRSTYAATRTSRRGVRCSLWFLLVHVVRFPVVASNLSRRPLQMTPKLSSFQTKCNFQTRYYSVFSFGMEALT